MSSLDFIKEGIKLAKEAGRIDLKEKLMTVQEELLNMKKENKSLHEQLDLRRSIVFDKGIYWIKEDPLTVNKLDTPICPHCWEDSEKTFRQVISKDSKGNQTIRCKHCNKTHHIGAPPTKKAQKAGRVV